MSLGDLTKRPRGLALAGTTPARRRRRGAFTLIELLIVIAIIGLLAALLIGGIRIALHTSRGTVCVNNLKRIGELSVFYAKDHSMKVVPYYDVTDANNQNNYWFTELLAIATNDPDKGHISLADPSKPDVPKLSELFMCPTDRATFKFNKDHLSYGLNADVMKENGDVYTSSNVGALTANDKKADEYFTTACLNPAEFVLICDTGYIEGDKTTHRNNRAWVSNRLLGKYPDSSGEYRPASGMHSGKANVLYGDGHVSNRSATSKLSGNLNNSDADTFRIWSLDGK